MTLNVPTFTKSAKIYFNLLGIYQQINAQINANALLAIDAPDKKKMKHKLNESYVDTLVRYSLKEMIKKLYKRCKKDKIHETEFIIASLEDNPFTDLFTKEYTS